MAPDTDADGAAAAAALPEGCLPVMQWLRRQAVAEVAAGVAPGRQLLQQHLEERMWAFLRQAFLVPRDFPTIGEALAHAPRWPPTTILVSPGRYEEELVVDRPVTLIGDALGLPGGISGGSGGSASGGRAELWGGGGGATGGDRRRAAAVLFDIDPELPVAPQLRGFAVAAGGVHGAAAREVCSAVAVARGAATVVGCSLSSSTGYGLWAYATGRLKLVDSELDGRKAAALFEGESSGFVRNNRLEKCASFGILVQHTASPVLEGNVFRGVKKAAVYVKDFAEPCVRECRFEANESSGVFVCESACPVVEKNEFRGHTMPAILVKDQASGLVRGNVIEGNLSIAVLLAGSTTVVLEGNDLRDNRKKSGTPASQQRVQAQSQALRVLRELEPEISSMRGTKRAAILVLDQAAPIVRGNSLSSNDGCGILVCNSANPTVEGNTIRNHWRPAIAIRNTARCLLRKNSLFDNEGGGVMVGENACPQIEENEFRGHKRHAAVYLGGSTRAHLRGNVFSGSAGYAVAVAVAGTARPTIEGNTFRDGAQPAIVVKGDARGLIRGNTIVSLAPICIVLRERAAPFVDGNTLSVAPALAAVDSAASAAAAHPAQIVCKDDSAGTLRDNRLAGDGAPPAALLVLDRARPKVSVSAKPNVGAAALACSRQRQLDEEGGPEHGTSKRARPS